MLEIVGTFVDRQASLFEKLLRSLLAVVDNLTGSALNIDMIGAEREKCKGRRQTLRRFQSFDGVEDAGRIIHHTERIDNGWEMVVVKPTPDFISKARAHTKHGFGRMDAERRFGNSDKRAEEFGRHVQ